MPAREAHGHARSQKTCAHSHQRLTERHTSQGKELKQVAGVVAIAAVSSAAACSSTAATGPAATCPPRKREFDHPNPNPTASREIVSPRYACLYSFLLEGLHTCTYCTRETREHNREHNRYTGDLPPLFEVFGSLRSIGAADAAGRAASSAARAAASASLIASIGSGSRGGSAAASVPKKLPPSSQRVSRSRTISDLMASD